MDKLDRECQSFAQDLIAAVVEKLNQVPFAVRR
jgi:hypothetical protein